MIKGEGSPEDGGDAASPTSSRYSSCGESEFERYCSANSVMGTPSVCSTITVYNDFPESDFGSVRNSGFLDDGSLENFSLGGNDRSQLGMNFSGDRKIKLSRGSTDGEHAVKYGSSGMELYDNGDFAMLLEDTNGATAGEMMSWEFADTVGLKGHVSLNYDSDRSDSADDRVEHTRSEGGTSELRTVLKIVGNGNSKGDFDANNLVGHSAQTGADFREIVHESSSSGFTGQKAGGGFDKLSLEPHLQFGTREEYMEEDLIPSEHSEGEDSGYNSSDDDGQSNAYLPSNLDSHPEARVQNENPLLINSSVAFGSNDWDDFENETERRSLDSLSRDATREKKQRSSNPFHVTSTSFPSIRLTEEEKSMMEMPVASEEIGACSGIENVKCDPNTVNSFEKLKNEVDEGEIPVGNILVQPTEDSDKMAKESAPRETNSLTVVEAVQDSSGISVANSSILDDDESTHASNVSINNVFRMEQDTQLESNNNQVSNQVLITSNDMDPLSVIVEDQIFYDSTATRGNSDQFPDGCNINRTLSVSESKLERTSPVSADLSEEHPLPVKQKNAEINEGFDEVVHEMEEILLDAGETPSTGFSQGNKMLQSHASLLLRDGGSTASTSGAADVFLLTQKAFRIDGVEVIGARQKKGDVSFSERLVGVKEHTVYRIRVWSGTDQWEVERRYRDFYSLYHQLKSLYADQGWTLPSTWLSVEKESRKIFGNASPDVVAVRSDIIQECLRSIIHSRFFSSTPSPLVWFLSPSESSPSSPASNTLFSQFSFIASGEDTPKVSDFGKTVPLIVELHPHRSFKQMLESQHYTCAGCHRQFESGKTLMQDFVQTFGFGKPRFCEYTGQLFCPSCHTNDTAVIPARVLHHWDFTKHPVFQLAKSYLDSIHDQPILCVSAVNPMLFSKVPALFHVMNIRKKIGSMFSYVRCPFRKSITKGLGSRAYLLENNDFFALRDLIDLSKGAFAALPVLMETVSRKILVHITEHCLVCCDVGAPCGARHACSDPSSLIFPFQEGEIERCPSCEQLFHRHCFSILINCPCGACLRVDEDMGPSQKFMRGTVTNSEGKDLLGRTSTSVLSSGFLSRLSAKSKLEMERTDSGNLILMDSLPTTSL